MPKERLILLSILIITLVAAGIILLGEGTLSPDLYGKSRITELEEDISEYEAIITDAKKRILDPEAQKTLLEEIEELKQSFFPQRYRENPGEFGKVVEEIAKNSGLHITGIQAVASGFQFETEGTATAALRFLKMMEEYQYRISTPFTTLAYMREGRWKCTVQCFPVFLDSEETE